MPPAGTSPLSGTEASLAPLFGPQVLAGPASDQRVSEQNPGRVLRPGVADPGAHAQWHRGGREAPAAGSARVGAVGGVGGGDPPPTASVVQVAALLIPPLRGFQPGRPGTPREGVPGNKSGP